MAAELKSLVDAVHDARIGFGKAVQTIGMIASIVSKILTNARACYPCISGYGIRCKPRLLRKAAVSGCLSAGFHLG